MKHPIGFCVQPKAPEAAPPTPAVQPEAAAVPSVVRVYFPERDRAFSYYNDRFDLHEGDVVYVSGKLAGLLGRVAAVDYNFRIRLADYERVIGAADRNVRGTFYVFGSHMLTLDHGALPYAQVRSWFFPPEADGEFVSGHGPGPTYTLDFLDQMPLPGETAGKGRCRMSSRSPTRAARSARSRAPVMRRDCASTVLLCCCSCARRSTSSARSTRRRLLRAIGSPP